jgi:RecB family endonuclease NucS
MVIGRQVHTGYGGFVDVLGVDLEGRVHVIELKRDRTPRKSSPRSWTTALGRRTLP